MTTASEGHFDEIAKEYDYWKNKNRYYYDNLMALYASMIPEGSRVLEVGCGTGDILAALKPSEGKGIDISEAMVARARAKYSGTMAHLSFAREDIFDTDTPFTQQYIFLADVLEHVDDARLFLKQLAARTPQGATVIMSVANPLWEPLLMLAEKLHMKMPEGPHVRLSVRDTHAAIKDAGFTCEEFGYRLLIPKRLPFSEVINKKFHALPLVRRLGFVVFWRLTR